jgi:hypothetical protein
MQTSNNDNSTSGSIRRLLWDISGAFGDIGVLFPLAIALIAKNGFNPTSLFLMAGLFYIISARYFRITMPVQPLKAMSAIAIATGLGFDVINAAGIVMGIILIFISISGLSVRLGAIFPVSVVRGIQLGLGLILVEKSLDLMIPDSSFALIAAAILALTILRFRSVPPLIPLMLVAVIMVASNINGLHAGWIMPRPALPSPYEMMTGFWTLVIPQIALTFGNAIVATEATGKLLYGERAAKLSFRNIPMSMGIANIVSGIMGGAPMCHGSGGLTAHRKFGATGERSGYIIGFALVILAIFFGRSILSIVSAFPEGILGALLCYVGIQHSLFVRDILHDKTAILIALTVAITGFILHNLTIGFAAGLLIHYGLEGTRRTMQYLANS